MSALPLFRTRVVELLRISYPYDDGRRATQADLAQAIGISRSLLNHKLSGWRGEMPSEREVRAIVRTFVEWGALTSRAEAEALLALAGVSSFGEREWGSPPLDILTPTTASTPKPAPAIWSHPIPPIQAAIGRRTELDELASHLGQATPTLIVSIPHRTAVLGVAGIGKTTLAAMYCHTQRGNYALIIWRDLRLNPHLGALVGEFARQSGRQFDAAKVVSEQEQALLLVDWLRSEARTVLLVLDNCESILAPDGSAEGGWGWLLEQEELGRARMLLTSRWHVRAGRRRLPIYQLRGMSMADGTALLRSAGLGAEDEGLLGAAVTRAGGHPLALILLAQLVTLDHHNLRELLAGQLWGEELAAALLDEVYKQLTEEEQSLLKYISIFDRPTIFRQPVSSEDIRGMLAYLDPSPTLGLAKEWSAGQIERVALALIRRSLLSCDEGRYTMHEIVQNYAYTKLESAIPYHLAAANYFASRYVPRANDLSLRSRAEVHPLLNAFEQFCAAGDYHAAYEIENTMPLETMRSGDEISLKVLLERWGVYPLLLKMARQLANAPEDQLTASERLHALNNLGTAHLKLGNFDEAIGYFKQAVSIAAAAHDQQGLGKSLGNLGASYTRLQHYAEAMSSFEEALTIAIMVGDQKSRGRRLGNIASCYYFLGQRTVALSYYQQALAIAMELGDQASECRTLGNMGVIYAEGGDSEIAVECYRHALEVAEATDNLSSQAFAWHNLGDVYSAPSHYHVALGCYLRSAAIREQTREPYIEETRVQIEATLNKLPADEAHHILAVAEQLVSNPSWKPWVEGLRLCS